MNEKQTELPINDPDTYAELSRPFATADEADEAIVGFAAEFRELRKKYRLANVLVVIKDTIQDSGPFMVDAACGSALEAEAMAAWLLGRVQGDRQDLIRRATEEGLRGAIKRAQG